MMNNKKQAITSLTNTIKYNPYYDDKNIGQLVNFADEIHELTGIEIEKLLKAEAQIICLGNNIDEVKAIIKTAANAGIWFEKELIKVYHSFNIKRLTDGRKRI